MEITFAKCEQVLNTLPIGYYTGRRIPVTLDNKAPTSYYNLMEDKITISYPIIAEGMKNVSEGADTERIIRSMIYHEVSHAILTPICIKPGDFISKTQHSVFNIFEDERIESVLRNYYYGVNFRQQVYDINGAPKVPQSAIGAFFNAVRYGCAPQRILDEVNTILRRYESVNRNSDSWTTNRYQRAVRDLYDMVAEEFNKDPEQFAPPDSEQGNDKNPSEEQEDMGEGLEFGAGEKDEDIDPTAKPKLAQIIEDTEHGLKNDLQQIQAMIKESLDIESRLSKGEKKQLHEFQRTAEMIINNFKKKNSGGAGINAYSGVFNPRELKRDDYRYFERSANVQGNNRFGTCHLNLFVDCSGSFCDSEAIINGILASLSAIERKNRNFTMDVIFCGVGVHVCKDVKERQIKCTGGNNLPDDLKEVFLKMQKPNTCNYNIVLFDGDAFSDDYKGTERGIRIFKAFDYKQTTVVTDNDNVVYLGGGFTASRVVVTDEYTAKLMENVLKALTVAFS